MADAIPRQTRRGLIEAEGIHRIGWGYQSQIPRQTRRGLIEASALVTMFEQQGLGFPGRHAGASLKPRENMGDRKMQE